MNCFNTMILASALAAASLAQTPRILETPYQGLPTSTRTFTPGAIVDGVQQPGVKRVVTECPAWNIDTPCYSFRAISGSGTKNYLLELELSDNFVIGTSPAGVPIEAPLPSVLQVVSLGTQDKAEKQGEPAPDIDQGLEQKLAPMFIVEFEEFRAETALATIVTTTVDRVVENVTLYLQNKAIAAQARAAAEAAAEADRIAAHEAELAAIAASHE